jgi:hypothetical protein
MVGDVNYSRSAFSIPRNQLDVFVLKAAATSTFQNREVRVEEGHRSKSACFSVAVFWGVLQGIFPAQRKYTEIHD